ncbi:hypothetical protein ACI2JA_19685 [Alkalihalobacillus sp. NPDC078783]|uniref:hypothetical protein n=1 Tax=Streptomyces albidoflavus TaxID=1886 RepID=UPI0033F4FE75
MGSLEFAKNELKRLGGENDEMQQEINKGILEIVKLFSEQGHSGSTASYSLSILERLLDFKPVTPLTGEEDEWGEPYDVKDRMQMQQNKRCSSVFRMHYDNATAYDIEAKVVSDDGGETWFQSKESFTPIEFPYVVPKEPERIIL